MKLRFLKMSGLRDFEKKMGEIYNSNYGENLTH